MTSVGIRYLTTSGTRIRVVIGIRIGDRPIPVVDMLVVGDRVTDRVAVVGITTRRAAMAIRVIRADAGAMAITRRGVV